VGGDCDVVSEVLPLFIIYLTLGVGREKRDTLIYEYVSDFLEAVSWLDDRSLKYVSYLISTRR
jgi:hypothetical protein